MSTSKPRSINGLFLLVAVVSLVFGSAGPAVANHQVASGGAVMSHGEEWGPNMSGFCSNSNNQFLGAFFTTTYYLITNDQSVFNLDSTDLNRETYEGPLSMNIQHGPAVFGPLGARPGTCNNQQVLTPTPVPLTKVTVLGQGNGALFAGGAVNCESLDASPGTYFRVESNVTFDFNVSCTVKGNAPTSTGGHYVWTNFELKGTQNTSGYLSIHTTVIDVSRPVSH